MCWLSLSAHVTCQYLSGRFIEDMYLFLSAVYKWRQPGAAVGQRLVPVVVRQDWSISGYRPRPAVPAQQGHIPQRPHLQGTAYRLIQ